MRGIIFVLIEIMAGAGAFLGAGQAVDKKATKFDKACGWLVCITFLLFIVFIEEVLK